MKDRHLFSRELRCVSPMNFRLLFEGSSSPTRQLVGFDLETYSPDGFPDSFEDPIVNFSLVVQSEVGLLILSFASAPHFELELLKLLRSSLEALNGGVLFTYNGTRFDLQYAVRRTSEYGLDFKDVFQGFMHVDLYRLLRLGRVQLKSYSQKSVERLLGIKRVVTEVTGANYHQFYRKFLSDGDLKPIFYNIEDSAGCLRLAKFYQNFLKIIG